MNRLSRWYYALPVFALVLGCFDTAMGQSFSLQDSKGNAVTQIKLAVSSGQLLSKTDFTISTATASDYSVSVTLQMATTFPFFGVTPTVGTTPVAISLYQQAIAPDATYSGSLTISSGTAGTTPLTIPVSIAVGGTAGTLTSDPTSLTFTIQSGQTASQYLTVSALNNAAVNFNAVPSTTSGANWLQVFPTTNIPTGTTKNVSVSVNAAGLAVGSYTGSIALTPTAGGPSTTVSVTLSVTGAPSLSFSPPQLSFAYQTGTGTSGLTQGVTFSTETGSGIVYSLGAQYLTGTPGWLVVNPLSGTVSKGTNQSSSVTVVPTSLPPGTYTAAITVAANGVSNPAQTIPVTLLVSTSPLLQVGTPPQPFNYQLGGFVPAARTVSLGSSSTPLAYGASITYDAASGSAKWLTITPVSGTTPATPSLSVTPSALPVGKYTATVTIASPGAANSPQQFQVVLNVSPNTMLSTQTSSLTFNYQTGGTLPTSQPIQITSTGAPLAFTASAAASGCGSGWLSVLPVSGTTPATVSVSVVPGGVAAGSSCSGAITISSTGASNSVSVPVTLNVSDEPLLNVVQNTLIFNVTPGSSMSTPQYIGLTSTDASKEVNYSAFALIGPGGGNWLFLGTGAGTTPANLAVTVIPGALPAGSYSGTVVITSPNSPSPQHVGVVMNVLSNVSIAATPASVSLTQTVGSSTDVSATVSIAATNSAIPLAFTALASVTTGANWLSVTPAGAFAPGTITVTANSNGQMSLGTYTGAITIQMPGAGNTPLTIPVSFVVGPSQTFKLTPASLSFIGSVGGLNPAAQTVQLASTGAAASYSIATSTSTCGGSWFSVSPLSGNTPGAFTVTPSLAGVAAGTCTGTITVSATGFAPQTLTVTLVVSAAPSPRINKVQNAAGYAFGAVSPGEIIYIEGTNLGPATLTQLTVDPATKLVTTNLAGTEVLFDGRPAPLVYVSSTKISAIVPYEVSGAAQTNLQIRRNGDLSLIIAQSVASTAPGIFTANGSGSGQAAALNQNGSYNGPACSTGTTCQTAPAPVGTVVTIYATGEGLVSPLPVTGSVTPGVPPFAAVVAPVTVKFGGVPLDPSDITYVGPAPTLVAGALQINFRVPGFALPNSATPVQIIIGDSASNSATVAVSAAKP